MNTSPSMVPDDEDELAETYAAQSEAAAEANWSAPEMAEYDNYDENYEKLGR